MSLDNLPVEWCLIQLGHIVNVNSGVGFPKEFQGRTDQPIPVYKVSDVSYSVLNQNGMLQTANNSVSQGDLDKLKGHLFNEGSTLFAKIGEAVKLNRRAYVKRKGLADNNVMGVTPLENVSNKYIFYFLHTIDLALHSRSTTIPSIRKSDIEELPISFPALAEQQEIVRQLDLMLAQVEQIKGRLDAIPAILKKFRQSVLADAVSGKLINQDFSSLGFLKLESLILDSGNGLSKRKGDSGNEVTVLRLADFKDAQRVFGNERSILLTEKELLKYKLLQNDILVVRVNGSVDIAGKFILHKDNEKDEAYCDHFIRLRIDQQKLLPEYLLYIANEGSGRDYLVNSLSTSAGQNTINQASIKGLQLRVPEIKYQDMIIQTVEKMFKHSFKIEETVLSAQKRVNLLTQSILAKAFSGELTAEWREQHQELITGVNSAESLLAKIQAEREASKPVKKAKKAKAV